MTWRTKSICLIAGVAVGGAFAYLTVHFLGIIAAVGLGLAATAALVSMAIIGLHS